MVKKLLILLSLIFLQTLVIASAQKVAILNFENKDRESDYVVKSMMKRDFKSVFKDHETLELIDMDDAEEVFEDSGISNISYVGSEEIAEMGKNLEADIVIWGDVSSISNSKFKVIAKIFSLASNDVTAIIFNVEKRSKPRRKVIEKELIAKLEQLSGGEIEQIKNIAMQHFNSKNFESAQESFLKLIKLEPKNVDAYFFLGIISYINENFIESIDYFNTGLDYDSDNVDILNYLSKSYRKIEDYENAVYALKQIADVEPNNKNVWSQIGEIYSSIEYYSEAQEALEKAISIDPEYDEAYKTLGVLLYDQGLFDQAISPLEKATQFYPDDDALQKKLAKCYFKTGKLDSAIANYKKVVKNQPDNVSAYFNLAGAYRVTNKNDLALQTLLKLKKLSPELPKVYFRLADIYIAIKDYTKAIQSVNKSIEIDPTLYQSYKIMALIKQSLGYKKYEKYLDYEEKYKDKSVYFGKKADELVEKRDKVKKEAYNYFIESGNYLDKTKARTDDPSILKEIQNSKKTLNQLLNATKDSAF